MKLFQLREIAATAASLAALGVIVHAITASHWTETVGIWPLHAFGLLMTALAIAKGGSRLLILLTPIFLIPLVMGVTLLFTCAPGNC